MAKISLRKACVSALVEIAKKDDRLIALEGDLSESTGSSIFKEMFPSRHVEMGIAEQNMVGVAAGLAACGKIPIVFSFACFISMRTCEQIRTSICYPKLNAKFFVSHAGLSAGSAGTTHHAIEDIAIMRAIPNMTVLAPGDPKEAHYAVLEAIKHDGPVYLRMNAVDVEESLTGTNNFSLGKSILHRNGNDITLMSTSTLVENAITASDILKEKYNITARVLQLSSIKPIDFDAIKKAVNETHHIITIEDHNIVGGFGSAVCEVVAELGSGQVRRLGINDHFCGVGSFVHILNNENLNSESIVQVAKGIVKK